MSLGLPVLPPEVIDFQTGETASGSGASDSAGVRGEIRLARWASGRAGSARPTISARGARSRMPANSASGSRADSGWGTAPSFQQARTAWINSIELGSAIDT